MTVTATELRDVQRVVDGTPGLPTYRFEDGLLGKQELYIYHPVRNVIISDILAILPQELANVVDMRAGKCWATDSAAVIVSVKPYCTRCQEYGHRCGDSG